MNAATKHFEVLASSGRTWLIQGVFQDEKEAVKVARERRTSGGFKSVKVVKVSFDEGSHTFREREVFFDGVKRKPSKYDDDEERPTVCFRVADFYSYHGLAMTRRLLRGSLNTWGITAIELVHHRDYIERLEDTGTILQGAVQRAAIAQVRETGQKVHERVRELYDMIEDGRQIVERDFREGAIVRLEDGDLTGLIARLEKASRKRYLFNVAVTLYLEECEGKFDKLKRLLGLLEQTEDEEACKLLDPFVAEFLVDASAISAVLGEKPDLGEAILDLAYLSKGELIDEMAQTDAARRLNRLIGEGKLPNCQAALLDRVGATVSGHKSLKPDLGDEVAFGARLHEALGDGSGDILGGEEMYESLTKRSARYMGAETVGRLLEDIEDPVARIERLLDIEPGILGAANKRKLGNYILPIVNAPNNAGDFIGCGGLAMERMKRLRALQARALSSGLSELQARHVSQKLDAYCMKIIASEKVFERIEASQTNAVDKGMSLLKLCAADIFTEGSALDLARTRTKQYLKRSGFLGHFVESIETDGDKASKLLNFQRLLAEAGIEA